MRRLRVLIAEDKELIAARLISQLERLGHDVLGVIRDGHAAAAAASQSQPDVILLDQHLPPQGGIEAAQEILANRIVPLLLIIGYPSAGLVRRAQQAGVLGYLVWPADTRMLGSAIEAARTRFREFRVVYEQAGDLEQALRTRLVVERAKKLLLRRLDLGEVDAFAYMHRQSRTTGMPLREVAAGLLTIEELCFGKSGLVGCVDTILNVLARREVLGTRRLPEWARMTSGT